MSLKVIKLGWLSCLLVLMLLSYRWPGFGTALACASVLVLGIANNLLSFQSKELGVFTGISIAGLALAASAGADLALLPTALLTAFGAIAGYVFVAFPVEIKTSEQESSPRNKSGGGGDFGGGGAGGQY